MAQKILLVYPEPYFLKFKGGIATYLRFAVEAHLSAGRTCMFSPGLPIQNGYLLTMRVSVPLTREPGEPRTY